MKPLLGLKLWSINTDYYLTEARRLFEEGVYDYLELYIVPGTLENLSKWRKLKIPYIIHCPHFAHGFNLAQTQKQAFNREIFYEVQEYADALQAPLIIIHGGMGGEAEETARQLAALHEARALIENKPHHVITKTGERLMCRGTTPEEIDAICRTAGCGFCLDFGHAICSANSHGVPWMEYVQSFLNLGPIMFHLSGIQDAASEIDSHSHISVNEGIVRQILRLVTDGKRISIETNKESRTDLNDFRTDVADLLRLLPS